MNEIIIKIKLQGSAQHETPQSLKLMAQSRMDAIIQNDPVMALFVAGYVVDVQ